MTPNGTRIRAQSRKEVYDRLHKIRLELEDLRRNCGRSDKDTVEALKRTCKKQEEEIEHLKTEHEEAQEQIKYLKMLLSGKGTDQTKSVEAETCIDHNANSQLLQDQLVDRLWAAEKHVWSLEAERDNLNILLSKKVVELNELQLLYCNQSKKLLLAERDRATPSSSRKTSSCDLSSK